MFFIIAGFYLVGATLYPLMATANIQTWAARSEVNLEEQTTGEELKNLSKIE